MRPQCRASPAAAFLVRVRAAPGGSGRRPAPRLVTIIHIIGRWVRHAPGPYWLSSFPAVQVVWGCAILALTATYLWATILFGIRFSNLTHRGILHQRSVPVDEASRLREQEPQLGRLLPVLRFKPGRLLNI